MCHARRGKTNHRVEFVRVSQYSEAYLLGGGLSANNICLEWGSKDQEKSVVHAGS